jgi:hypothetical protein
MNSIEEESTFFVSIDKKNIKNQINNFKNVKSKYFCQTIKTIKTVHGMKHVSSASFPDKKMINEQSNKAPQISNQKNQINNTLKLNNIKNFNLKDNRANSFNLAKKDHNNAIDTEENIDIDDTDEYNDIKFNINKPKLPFYNRNNMIVNNYNDKAPSNVSRNIFSNCLNKISSNKSQIIKPNKNNSFYKNYSISFDNKDLLKLKINQNVAMLNSKIDMLKNIIKSRNIQILSMQLIFEKANATKKIKKYNLKYDKIIDEIRKKIFDLKIIKSKCEENFVNKKNFEKEINQEKIEHSTQKAILIEKILDCKMYIINKKNEYTSNNNNINNNEESTIVNDSLFIDNESNILETKENLNMSEQKVSKLKSSNRLLNKEEEDLNINNHQINCMKNKKVANYFIPRFLIETKTKNKNKIRYNNDKQFNIFINSNNGK